MAGIVTPSHPPFGPLPRSAPGLVSAPAEEAAGSLRKRIMAWRRASATAEMKQSERMRQDVRESRADRSDASAGVAPFRRLLRRSVRLPRILLDWIEF
jgi:hypothetical protein